MKNSGFELTTACLWATRRWLHPKGWFTLPTQRICCNLQQTVAFLHGDKRFLSLYNCSPLRQSQRIVWTSLNKPFLTFAVEKVGSNFHSISNLANAIRVLQWKYVSPAFNYVNVKGYTATTWTDLVPHLRGNINTKKLQIPFPYHVIKYQF